MSTAFLDIAAVQAKVAFDPLRHTVRNNCSLQSFLLARLLPFSIGLENRFTCQPCFLEPCRWAIELWLGLLICSFHAQQINRAGCDFSECVFQIIKTQESGQKISIQDNFNLSTINPGPSPGPLNFLAVSGGAPSSSRTQPLRNRV